MTTRDTPWPPGTPCWVDLSATDLDAAKAFYGSVLGWDFVDTGDEFGHYTLAQVGGKPVAAISPPPPGHQPMPWTVYLATEDTDATAKLIAEHGGTVVVGPMPIPGMGTMALATDPTGGLFGTWQADGMLGFELANEPGAVVWTDDVLSDPAAGKEFFSAVFDYTYQPVPDAPADYSMIVSPGSEHPIGGIGGATGEAAALPSHWIVYFTVADLGVAEERIVVGGGATASPAADTPFGRIGTYADPAGVLFGLHQELPT